MGRRTVFELPDHASDFWKAAVVPLSVQVSLPGFAVVEPIFFRERWKHGLPQELDSVT